MPGGQLDVDLSGTQASACTSCNLLVRSYSYMAKEASGAMLSVYDNEFSSCSTKVRLVLHEKGVPWVRHRIDLVRFDQKTDAYLRINRNGVVPVAVEDGGDALTGSHVIIQYLDNAYAGPSLSPEGALSRARMQMWLKEVDELHAVAGVITYDQLYLPYWRGLPNEEFEAGLARFAQPEAAERLRFLVSKGLGAERVAASKAAAARIFERVEAQLAKSPWLTGERYGLADAALTPYIDSPLHAISSLWHGKAPGISNWLARIRERPNYAQAVLRYPNPPEFEAAIAAAPEGSGRRLI